MKAGCRCRCRFFMIAPILCAVSLSPIFDMFFYHQLRKIESSSHLLPYIFPGRFFRVAVFHMTFMTHSGVCRPKKKESICNQLESFEKEKKNVYMKIRILLEPMPSTPSMSSNCHF